MRRTSREALIDGLTERSIEVAPTGVASTCCCPLDTGDAADDPPADERPAAARRRRRDPPAAHPRRRSTLDDASRGAVVRRSAHVRRGRGVRSGQRGRSRCRSWRGSGSTRSPNRSRGRDLRGSLLLDPPRQLKPLLLDQHVIAGIGNIYADEILHARPAAARSRRRRRSTAGQITPAARSIVDVLGGGDRRRRLDARRRPVRRPDGVGRVVPGRPPGLRPRRRTVPHLRPADGSGARRRRPRRRTSAPAASADASPATIRGIPAGAGDRRVGSPTAVFLKRLTLKGFKSFADSTTMVLEPGVTVVVGPNGSGKSNVVDAIAWVLGAQAPKCGAQPEDGRRDLRRHGEAPGARPRRGEHHDRQLRRHARRSSSARSPSPASCSATATAEYSINGVPCRLLDVQELLSDAGVGRQQHVIVSQGQIDAVLNARPEERRAIIEEAAGVLKFRKRKEKAERRLDATEANLLRVQDLLREVRRQLRPLERQAAAAERHGDADHRAHALKTFVAGREIASWRVAARVARRRPRLDSATAESELQVVAGRPRHRGDGDRGRAVGPRRRATPAIGWCASSSCANGPAAWPPCWPNADARWSATAASCSTPTSSPISRPRRHGCRDELEVVAANSSAVRPEADELDDEEARFAERARPTALEAVGTERPTGLARGAAPRPRSAASCARCARPATVARRGAPARGPLELARPSGSRRSTSRPSGSVRSATRPGASRNHWSPRSRWPRRARRRGRRRHRGAPVAARRRRRRRGSTRPPGSRRSQLALDARPRPRRRRTTRRRRRRARHAARPGRDRRRAGGRPSRPRSGESLTAVVVDDPAAGRARARRAARLGHERRGASRSAHDRSAPPNAAARRSRAAARPVVEAGRGRAARRAARGAPCASSDVADRGRCRPRPSRRRRRHRAGDRFGLSGWRIGAGELGRHGRRARRGDRAPPRPRPPTLAASRRRRWPRRSSAGSPRSARGRSRARARRQRRPVQCRVRGARPGAARTCANSDRARRARRPTLDRAPRIGRA